MIITAVISNRGKYVCNPYIVLRNLYMPMISYNLETSVLLRDGITESLRHEETLEGLSSYFLLKAGTINQNHKLRLGCSVLIQLGLENFQSWRLYNLSGQPVPMGGYLHNSFFFFFFPCAHSYSESLLFSTLGHHLLFSCHGPLWRTCLYVFAVLPGGTRGWC